MRRLHSTLVRTISAILIGLTVGLLFNRYFRPKAPSEPVVIAKAPSSPSGIDARRIDLPEHPLDLRPTVAALETASLDEIRRFLDRLGPTDKVTGPRAFPGPVFSEWTPATRALYAVALKRWISRDPNSAWDYVLGRAKREGAVEFWIDAAIGAWSEVDPPSAAHALANPEFPGARRDRGGKILLHLVAERDPKEAFTLAQQHRLGDSTAYRSIFSRLAENDLKGAAQRAEDLPAIPVSNRDSAIKAVARKWAATDPENSLNWLDNQVSDGGGRAVHDIVMAWAERSPEDAAKKIETLELSKFSRQALLGHTLAQWSEQDAQAALDWLEAHQRVPGEAEALQGVLIDKLSQSNPAAAAALDA